MELDPIQVAALRSIAGIQAADKLPFIAADALVRGLDSPLLREAAAVAPGDSWEAETKFRSAAEELGMQPNLDKQASLELLVRHIASSIVDGTTDPVNGANEIWRLSYDVEREGDLRIFIGLASEAEDHQGYDYEPDIRRAAAELLDRPALRRWVRLQAVEPEEWPVRNPAPRRPMNRGDLGLSATLCSEIEDWTRSLPLGRATTRWSSVSPFENEEQAVTFVDAGKRLAAKMQTELGESWHVEYYPEPIRPVGGFTKPQ